MLTQMGMNLIVTLHLTFMNPIPSGHDSLLDSKEAVWNLVKEQTTSKQANVAITVWSSEQRKSQVTNISTKRISLTLHSNYNSHAFVPTAMKTCSQGLPWRQNKCLTKRVAVSKNEIGTRGFRLKKPRPLVTDWNERIVKPCIDKVRNSPQNNLRYISLYDFLHFLSGLMSGCFIAETARLQRYWKRQVRGSM